MQTGMGLQFHLQSGEEYTLTHRMAAFSASWVGNVSLVNWQPPD